MPVAAHMRMTAFVDEPVVPMPAPPPVPVPEYAGVPPPVRLPVPGRARPVSAPTAIQVRVSAPVPVVESVPFSAAMPAPVMMLTTNQ